MQAVAAAPASYRIPNLVIAVRVALAFVAVSLYSLSFPFAVSAVVLTLVVIYLDALDGQLARRLGVASDLGGVLDVTADRIVEHVFWIYFAVDHQVAAWVPLVIVTRSFLVDAARSAAFAHGRTAFGDRTMMRSRLSRFLVASRFMRNAYGFAKVAAFVLLGSLVALEAVGAPAVTAGAESALRLAARVVVIVAVALNLLRGVPVIWESRRYLIGNG